MGYPFYILLMLLLAAGVVAFVQWKKILGLKRLLNAAEQQRQDLYFEKERLQKVIDTHSERRDFKVKLISMLAHDFRGAFMNIISLMDYYKSGDIPLESFSSLFEELKSTSRKNLDAFENTLAWVRTQLEGYKFNPQPLSVFQVIKKAVDNNRSEIKRKGISLSIKGEKEVQMLADAHLLDFVVNCLVNNAVKFSHPGGTVDCVIKNGPGNHVQLIVADSGVGMDEKTRASVFSHDKTIYTGTLGEKGAGIALLICKDFIEIQQGKLDVVSSEGGGAAFTLSLSAYDKLI